MLVPMTPKSRSIEITINKASPLMPPATATTRAEMDQFFEVALAQPESPTTKVIMSLADKHCTGMIVKIVAPVQDVANAIAEAVRKAAKLLNATGAAAQRAYSNPMPVPALRLAESAPQYGNGSTQPVPNHPAWSTHKIEGGFELLYGKLTVDHVFKTAKGAVKFVEDHGAGTKVVGNKLVLTDAANKALATAKAETPTA